MGFVLWSVNSSGLSWFSSFFTFWTTLGLLLCGFFKIVMTHIGKTWTFFVCFVWDQRNGIFFYVLGDLYPSFVNFVNLWITDNVLPQGDFCLRPWRRDGSEALGFNATRPVVDPNLEFLRRFASFRNWVLPVYGGVCEGEGVSGLLRQRVCSSSRFNGPLEDLLREEARGFGLGLA